MMKTLTAAVALSAGLAAPALAFDVTAMSDAEREAFRAEVRAYLLENPQVIFDAVDVAEQRQAEQMAAGDEQLVTDNAGAIFDDGYSWVGGNPDGDITVVEFMDYRCGYCRKAHDEVAELIEGDGNVRLIVKEFPILGEASVISTRFALAVRMVAGDDAYEAARDALIALTSDMSEPVLRRLANSLDLDADAVLAAMDDPGITSQIEFDPRTGADACDQRHPDLRDGHATGARLRSARHDAADRGRGAFGGLTAVHTSFCATIGGARGNFRAPAALIRQSETGRRNRGAARAVSRRHSRSFHEPQD